MAIWRFDENRCDFERVPAIARDDDYRDGLYGDDSIYLVVEPDPDSLFGWLVYLDEGGGLTRLILPYEETFVVCGVVFDRDGYVQMSYLPDPVEQSVKKCLAEVAERVRMQGNP